VRARVQGLSHHIPSHRVASHPCSTSTSRASRSHTPSQPSSSASSSPSQRQSSPALDFPGGRRSSHCPTRQRQRHHHLLLLLLPLTLRRAPSPTLPLSAKRPPPPHPTCTGHPALSTNLGQPTFPLPAALSIVRLTSGQPPTCPYSHSPPTRSHNIRLL
jgi:hypothetical protein